MKILYTVSAFPPVKGKGGAPVSASNLSSRLANQGHDVTVFTTDLYTINQRQKIKSNPIERNGVEVYYFRNLFYRLAWDKNIPLPVGLIPALRKKLQEFDIVHVDLLRGFEAVAIHHYTQKFEIPYVLQPRGAVPRINKSHLKYVFDLSFGRDIVADAAKIIASSEVELAQYPNVYPNMEKKNIVKIPNGVNSETYCELPPEGTFSSRFGIKDDKKIVLFLSRIHERKGPDLLLEAFERVKKENIKLVYVGPDDGFQSKLQTLVTEKNLSENVIFTGPLYGDEKLAAYVDADLFVLPSKDEYESFGNVVLEALACGTPAVMTTNCGVSDWLPDKVSYTSSPSVPSIAAAIEDLLCSPLKMERMGSAGRELVLNNFDWNRVQEDTEKVYHEALKNS